MLQIMFIYTFVNKSCYNIALNLITTQSYHSKQTYLQHFFFS